MGEERERLNETQLRRIQPYPEYKASGIEWIGEIPAHWSALPIKRVCRFVYGESLAAADRVNGEFAVFGSNGRVGTHDRPNTSAPCLIVGRKGSSGKVNYSTLAVFAIDTTFAIDARHTKEDLRWLYYALQSSRLDTISKDSAIPGLDREDAYARAIAIGPTREQRTIARFLDCETAKIDALVAKKERLIELLREKRTALITRAVTRGLDASVPMKDSGVEWLGEIPARWKTTPAGRVVHGIEQGWSPVAEDRPAARDEWGVIKLSAVSAGNFREAEHKTLPSGVSPDARYEIREKDFLLTRSNTPDLVGDVCVVGVVRSQLMLCDLVYRLNVMDDRVDRRFLAYWFLGRAGRHQIEVDARGSSRSMVKVSQGIIRAWTVATPPLEEQAEIVTFLDRETANIDALITRVREAVVYLKEYRTALISASVTGKIDVRDEAA